MCDFTGQISIDGVTNVILQEEGEFFVKLFSRKIREIKYNNIMIRNNNLKTKSFITFGNLVQ